MWSRAAQNCGKEVIRGIQTEKQQLCCKNSPQIKGWLGYHHAPHRRMGPPPLHVEATIHVPHLPREKLKTESLSNLSRSTQLLKPEQGFRQTA